MLSKMNELRNARDKEVLSDIKNLLSLVQRAKHVIDIMEGGIQVRKEVNGKKITLSANGDGSTLVEIEAHNPEPEVNSLSTWKYKINSSGSVNENIATFVSKGDVSVPYQTGTAKIEFLDKMLALLVN